MIWSRPKQFGHDQNNLYQSKTIWAVQNHFGPIEGQGIRVKTCRKISNLDNLKNYPANQILYDKGPSVNYVSLFLTK